MYVDWEAARCVLCAAEASGSTKLTKAHLIPQSLGGFFWSQSECRTCNGVAGHRVESRVLRDDSIIFCLHALREALPGPAAEFDARVVWLGRTEHGQVRARLRSGAFEIVPGVDPGQRSRVQATPDARQGLETRLRRANRTPEEIRAALVAFDAAPVDVPVTIHGETFVQRKGPESFALPFDGTPVTEAFPSLIAFRFLALALGNRIFDAPLDELRDSIRVGQPQSEWHVAERWIDRDAGYQPWHLVGFAQTRPHAVVRVQLFGWNVWRVHFPRIRLPPVEPAGVRFDIRQRAIQYASPIARASPLAAPST